MKARIGALRPSRLQSWLFAVEPAHPLALFRIILPVLMVSEFWILSRPAAAYVSAPLYDFMPLLEGLSYDILRVAWVAALAGLCVGFQTRWSAFAVVGLTVVFYLATPQHYLHGRYFAWWLVILLGLSPSGQVLSVDAVLRRRRNTPEPTWTFAYYRRLFQLMMCLVLFWAALAKFSLPWLSGLVMKNHVMAIRHFSRLASPSFLASDHAIQAVAVGMFLAELTLPFMLLSPRRRIRLVGVTLACMVFAAFGIGLRGIGPFSLIAISTLIFWIEPEWLAKKIPAALLVPRGRLWTLTLTFAFILLAKFGFGIRGVGLLSLITVVILIFWFGPEWLRRNVPGVSHAMGPAAVLSRRQQSGMMVVLLVFLLFHVGVPAYRHLSHSNLELFAWGMYYRRDRVTVTAELIKTGQSVPFPDTERLNRLLRLAHFYSLRQQPEDGSATVYHCRHIAMHLEWFQRLCARHLESHLARLLQETGAEAAVFTFRFQENFQPPEQVATISYHKAEGWRAVRFGDIEDPTSLNNPGV